ncbi:MAG: hypothetical protein COY80_04320 [Candidatus Pacebacteria bacterium CG_4_10_14_0_8_um_filter_42_14]|nr:MAG: hypothetical protein COY80_04320 [Candidatus Pacebacteria bacterium CG_4_10_14_0_8_um_filter_42_14]
MRKIIKDSTIKFIEHPAALFFSWILFLLIPVVNFLRLFIISHDKLVDENLRVLLSKLSQVAVGFLSIYSLSLFFVCLYYFSNRVILKQQRKAFLFIVSSGVIFFVINSLLISLEGRKFPNYLYSTIGSTADFLSNLNLLTLFNLALVLIILFQRGSLFHMNSKANKSSLSKKFAVIIHSSKILIVLILIFSFISSINTILNFRSQYKNAQISYEQRFGDEYEFVKILKATVPERSSVIHPPQNSTWPFIGNQPIIRYFLFPRRLISGVLLNNRKITQEISAAYFAEIYSESTDKHWPLVDTSNKAIIFDQKTSIEYSELEKVAEVNGVVIYKISFL